MCLASWPIPKVKNPIQTHDGQLQIFRYGPGEFKLYKRHELFVEVELRCEHCRILLAEHTGKGHHPPSATSSWASADTVGPSDQAEWSSTAPPSECDAFTSMTLGDCSTERSVRLGRVGR